MPALRGQASLRTLFLEIPRAAPFGWTTFVGSKIRPQNAALQTSCSTKAWGRRSSAVESATSPHAKMIGSRFVHREEAFDTHFLKRHVARRAQRGDRCEHAE